MKTDNIEYCKNIALELEKIYDSDDYGLPEYIADEVLDVQYIMNSHKELQHVRLYITIGGPTVWIDTEHKAVKLTWGTESAEYGLDWDVCDAIENYYYDLVGDDY